MAAKDEGFAAHSANRYLRIYLQDHLAGATGGLRLVERAARHQDGELGEFLRELREEIREDRRALLAVMKLLEIPSNSLKNALVALGELTGRLKTNGHLTGSSPLTPLIELETLTGGVSGKRSLWQVLSQLRDPRLVGFDFEQLVDRADKQLTSIEAHRLGTSGKAFGGGKESAEAHSAGRSHPGTSRVPRGVA